MLCKNCGTENPETYRFCGACGVPLEIHLPNRPVPEDQPEYLPIAPKGVAPAFLDSMKSAQETMLSWAQKVSDELDHELHISPGSAVPESTRNRVRPFVADIQKKRQDLEDMDRRIRQVYKQIRPSSEYGSTVTRFAINKEMFEALEIRKGLSRQLDAVLLMCESLSRGFERE
jgi:hypothetical protein